jgi:hypothetical protein
MIFNIHCREASRKLSEAADRKLPLSDRITLRIHLGICDACTNFSKQLEFLRRAMQSYPGPDSPDDGAPADRR